MYLLFFFLSFFSEHLFLTLNVLEVAEINNFSSSEKKAEVDWTRHLFYFFTFLDGLCSFVTLLIRPEKFCMQDLHLGAPCFSSTEPTLHVDMRLKSVHLTGGVQVPYINAPLSVESHEIKGGDIFFSSFLSLFAFSAVEEGEVSS